MLALLQPFEELKEKARSPQKTVKLEYNSIPPQLVVAKAIRNGHFVLASMCLMALLANLLAVALSGLFFEDNIRFPQPQMFPAALSPTIYNGSFGGMDDLYTVMSNLTSGTPMRPWTDRNYFYTPFDIDASTSSSNHFQGRTRAFGAKLQCSPLPLMAFDQYGIGVHNSTNWFAEASIAWENFPRDAVNSSKGLFDPVTYGSYNALEICDGEPAAAEYLMLFNDTSPSYKDAFAIGWVRGGPETCKTNSSLTEHQHTSMLCRPELVTGTTDVTVDQTGRLIESKPFEPDTQELQGSSGDSLFNLTRFMNYNFVSNGCGGVYILDLGGLLGPGDAHFCVSSWHNDSFPSDFINHFMTQVNNGTDTLDPLAPPPSFQEASRLVSDVYSRLFSTLLGAHSTDIFKPVQAESSGATIQGFELRNETRVFMSTPMFIIAETILAAYVISTALLLLNRPARFLPRLPSTLASVIAYFAASHAVLDFRGDANIPGWKREAVKYGYGTFIGRDGKRHIGIEKEPYLLPDDDGSFSSTPGFVQRFMNLRRRR